MFFQSFVGKLFDTTVYASVSVLLLRYVGGFHMMLEVASILDNLSTLFAGIMFTFYRIMDNFH